MQAMVDKGEMTEQQMREKLVWMRQMIGKSKATSKTITREDYAAAQAKMQVMVEKGEITQAQMDERLMGMRRMIGKSKVADKTITREDYVKAEAEMKKMVAEGKITEDQMNARLNRMRKMSARGGGNSERREISDECMELGRRIRTAVENGDMTSEEARKLWNAEGCP
jgi:polyhydroxyalkanoate synthesis regulator phasin